VVYPKKVIFDLTADTKHSTFLIQVKGLVQGVGFRPFIYRIAHELDVKGWVENRNDGVIIKVNGNKTIIDQFIQDIKSKAPTASNIHLIKSEKVDHENFQEFQIVQKENPLQE